MRKHIIIIASIHLFLGLAISILFIYGHVQFFSFYSTVMTDQSVMRDNHSIMQKASDLYQVYRTFFESYDINPLFSLFTIISSLSFGYGLLKSKHWAVILGFGLIALNAYSFVSAVFSGAVSMISIIQLIFTAYMWWVLCRKQPIAV